MGTATSDTDDSGLKQVLKPFGRGATYRRLLYMVLTVPLGVLYFFGLTLGLMGGLGLAITVFGIPLLLGVILGSRYLVALERYQIQRLLGTKIEPPTETPIEDHGLWTRIQIRLYAGTTWKGILFLYAKAAFVLLVTLTIVGPLLVGIAATMAPVVHLATGFDPQLLGWRLDTPVEAGLLVPVGAGLIVVAVTLSELLTPLWIRFCKMLLDKPRR